MLSLNRPVTLNSGALLAKYPFRLIFVVKRYIGCMRRKRTRNLINDIPVQPVRLARLDNAGSSIPDQISIL